MKERSNDNPLKAALETNMRGWMAQALAGDAAAYEKLLNQIASIVRGYLMNVLNARVRSEEKVEDLVQETLLAIHKKKHLYTAGRPILPWIFAIARYRLIDSVRAEERRPTLVNWEEYFDSDLFEQRTAEAKTDAGAIDELTEGLTDRQKEVLLLAKVEELPLAEVAKRLQMSLSAVKVTVHRAIKELRKRKGVEK